MAKKRKAVQIVEVEDKRSGCLPKIVLGFVIMILLATVVPLARDESDPSPTARATTKATATARATAKPKPTSTPAIPGTYRPGIKGTNAYDVTVAMKQVGVEQPKRENTTDGYRWATPVYKEDGVSYQLEIESDKDYRITTMQIMMQGGNNNFLWWACACVFGEESEQITWLKENMWNTTTTTKTFSDDVWTINPMDKGVFLTVQHVDAEAWYMSLI